MKNKIIAVIPARSGSKSVKDKNIKMLAGKPLIAYSIEQCFKSRLFKNVYVSTDSKKYARISQRFGPVKIILRPKKISNDMSTDYEMIKHLIDNIDDNYEYIAHIRPTTPQRNIKDLKKAISAFINSNFSSLRSVHEMSESSYKTVEILNGQLKTLKKLKLSLDDINMPRQNFPKTYSPNGVIDIYKKSIIINKKKLLGNKIKAFITSRSQEVDVIEDFKYLEYLWQNK
jgi:CMP-N,N'-diacetyllegionaminic acid synthase